MSGWAKMGAVDVCVAEQRLASVCGQRSCAGIHRERDSLRRAFEDRTLGIDHLLVAAHLIGARR